jgi:hypothetical protein
MKKYYVIKKNYDVSIIIGGQEVYENDFTTFSGAVEWATKKLRASKICDIKAIITNMNTGEIMIELSR